MNHKVCMLWKLSIGFSVNGRLRSNLVLGMIALDLTSNVVDDDTKILQSLLAMDQSRF